MANRKSGMTDEGSEYGYETDAFTCSICYSRLSDIKMCPRCSKMFHGECLERWLKLKQTCPNCISTLTPEDAVLCRWGEEVIQNINDLETKNRKMIEERKRVEAANRMVTLKEKYAFKIIIIGDIAVGKTALLRRYADEDFALPYPSTTAFEFVHRKIMIAGDIIRLILVDTAGQEQFDSIATSFYRDADAVMIAFDVTRKMTFDRIERWHAKVLLNAEKDPLMLLVACKTDLIDKRAISTETGVELAQSLGVQYLETSSIQRVNIEEAFYSIAATLKAKQDAETETDFRKRVASRQGTFKLGQSGSKPADNSTRKRECKCS